MLGNFQPEVFLPVSFLDPYSVSKTADFYPKN